MKRPLTTSFLLDVGVLQLLVAFSELDPFIARVVSLFVASSLTWIAALRSRDKNYVNQAPIVEGARIVVDFFIYAALVQHIEVFRFLPAAACLVSFPIGQGLLRLGSRLSMNSPRSNQARVSIVGTAVQLIAACIIFSAANYAFNAFLATIDKESIRSNLRQAFEVGDLRVASALVGNSDLGVHQTTDCLIFDMASQETIDPVIYLFGGARTESAQVYFGSNCASLRDRLVGDPAATGTNWYLRYLHGDRAAAIVLLEFISVSGARAALKIVAYAVFSAGILINLFFALRQSNLSFFSAVRSNHCGYALVAACFLIFFGLPYFGQSITMAPAMIVLGLFILAWSILDWLGALSERSAASLAMAYGLLTAYFEFLTGYTPVGVCLIVALVTIHSSRRPVPMMVPVRMLAITIGCFCAALVGAFALHQIATATFHPLGKDIFLSFLFALSVRMGSTAGDLQQGDPITLTDLGNALLAHLPHLSVFNETVMVCVLLTSFGLCLFLTADVFLRDCPWAHKASVLFAALSFVPVGIWILLFKNHTVVHSSFMVRMLVVVPMAGILTFFLWTRVSISQALASDVSPFGSNKAIKRAHSG